MVFQVVARLFLGGFNCVPGVWVLLHGYWSVVRVLLGCCYGFVGGCLSVARQLLWFSRWLLTCSDGISGI